MAKKKQVAPAEPKVSQLPLPASDTPVVIDLPDGQKLVIGQLAAGSVIEVATWRGTGRPDSRTSRLMLGMSGASGAAAIDQREIVEDVKPPAKGGARVLQIVQEIPKIIIKFGKVATSKAGAISLAKLNPISVISAAKDRSRPTFNSSSSKEAEELTGSTTQIRVKNDSISNLKASDDIEAWLDSVMEKSRNSAKKSAAKPKAKAKPKSPAKTTKPKKR
ncbi:MAG: hypothetical protein QNL07_05685 [Candidatus Planktophila sp.]